jgi:PAS domain S-box-containing protein
MQSPPFEPAAPRRDHPESRAGVVPPRSPLGDGSGAVLAARRAKRVGRRSALRIAGIYALCGGLWIYSSDWLLAAVVTDPHLLTRIQNYKGWAFVLGSALLLYLLMRWDAQAREHIEVALRARDEHLRLIGENSADLIWIRDLASGRYSFLSPSVCRLIGFTSEEVMARGETSPLAPVSARFAAEILPRRIAALEAGDESVRVQTDTMDLLHRNGSLVPVEVVTTLMSNEAGRVVQMIGVVRNIAERRRTEEEMHRVRQWLEHAERIGQAGSWAFDLRNDQVWASPEARRIYGFDDRQYTIADIQTVPRPEFRAALNQALHDLIERDKPYAMEFQISRRTDGAIVDIRSVAEYDRANGIVIGVIQDVTEQKRTEARLAEQSAQLASLSANMPGIIFRFAARPDGLTGFQYVSESIRMVLGLEPSAILADPDALFRMIHADDRAEFNARLATTIREHCAWDWEGRGLIGGRTVWMRSMSTPRSLPDGTTVWDGVIVDTTANRQAEAKIREQAELLDTANDAIYVTTLDGAILYWNQGAERLYGWTLAEVLNRNAADLFSADAKTAGDQTAGLVEQGNWTGERRQRTKAGREVMVFTRLTLVRGEQGQPRAVFAIATDITEKKQLEAQFLRAQRVESLGALSGGIAHDLNNVLTPILMAMPLLRTDNLSRDSRKLLDTMETSVRRGAAIVKQVLTFARGVQGERVPLPPGLFLEEMARMAGETFPKNIRIDRRVPETPALVLGDATQLHQAILNLCLNARDAMPAGGVLTLAAQAVAVDEKMAQAAPGAKPGLHVCISVSDTGDGIAPENLERLFEPFFTTKAHGKGTGLGLSTVSGITRSHGGFVRVLSTVGQGSRFELYLPATTGPKVGSAAAAPGRSPEGQGETILVVDDEAAVCELIRRVLERHGYRVLVASGGAVALPLFEREPAAIRVVITDMMMPEMDGPTLVQQLRKIDPGVRVIGISGAGDEALTSKISRLELAGFLAKPFAVETLLARLERVLSAAPKPPV